MIERMIRVTVSADVADLVSDRMWGWGVRGVEERSLADGRVCLSTSVGNDGEAIARALGNLDPSWHWAVDDIDATAAEDWKRFAEPIRCRDDLVIAPAWYDGDVGGPEDLVIRIDPAGAFGLGDHPTTRSSLRALADELDTRDRAGRPARSLLDVGCGTGALAILGAMRDVPDIRAIDIADAAVAATLDNAVRNGVGGRITVDTAELGELARPAPGGYDVIMANILAPVLISLADDLIRLLADDGTLVISGVLGDDTGHGHDHVLDALRPLAVASTIDADGWATVSLRRDAGE